MAEVDNCGRRTYFKMYVRIRVLRPRKNKQDGRHMFNVQYTIKINIHNVSTFINRGKITMYIMDYHLRRSELNLQNPCLEVLLKCVIFEIDTCI